jgi:hypothetical protein
MAAWEQQQWNWIFSQVDKHAAKEEDIQGAKRRARGVASTGVRALEADRSTPARIVGLGRIEHSELNLTCSWTESRPAVHPYASQLPTGIAPAKRPTMCMRRWTINYGAAGIPRRRAKAGTPGAKAQIDVSFILYFHNTTIPAACIIRTTYRANGSWAEMQIPVDS